MRFLTIRGWNDADEPFLDRGNYVPRGRSKYIFTSVVAIAFATAGFASFFVSITDTTDYSFPEPTSVEHANQLIENMPHGDAKEMYETHVAPHLAVMYTHFLTSYGTTYPNWSNSSADVATAARHTVTDDEFAQRLRIFGNQILLSMELNYKFRDLAAQQATFGITPFSDWTDDEIKLNLLNDDLSNMSGFSVTSDEIKELTTGPVKSKNWAVQFPVAFGVRNQGACGSCWAHAATEELRQHWRIHNADDIGKLSVQHLVDCMYQGNQQASCKGGCCGGNYITAWQHIHTIGGLPTQAAYGRYTGTPGACRAMTPTITTAGYRIVAGEASMAQAVYKKGPLAISVAATSLSRYTGGILQQSQCVGPVNHAVQLVGYDAKLSAWIVMNSWGIGWGVSRYPPYKRGKSNGFVLLAYGHDTCRITAQPAMPKSVTAVRTKTVGPLQGYSRKEFDCDGKSLVKFAQTTHAVCAAYCDTRVKKCKGFSFEFAKGNGGTCILKGNACTKGVQRGSWRFYAKM